MRLMDATTATEIVAGSMIRPVEGPSRPWRFESITSRPDGTHLVHATQASRAGRVHKHFHPHAFGLDIVIDVEITRRAHVRNVAHHTWSKANDYLLAGIFALVPLAFFEHFHVAERIFAAFTTVPHSR
jgi:hypothetical protein